MDYDGKLAERIYKQIFNNQHDIIANCLESCKNTERVKLKSRRQTQHNNQQTNKTTQTIEIISKSIL